MQVEDRAIVRRHGQPRNKRPRHPSRNGENDLIVRSKSHGALCELNRPDPVLAELNRAHGIVETNLAAAFQQIVWDAARRHPQSGVARGRFEAWAQALPEGLRGLLDDRHGDGLANLARWALGIGPDDTDYDERLLTVSPNGAGHDWIRFRLGADAEDAGATVSVEWSPQLVEWFDGAPAGTATNRTGEQIEILPSAAWTNAYLRLRIRLPGGNPP